MIRKIDLNTDDSKSVSITMSTKTSCRTTKSSLVLRKTTKTRPCGSTSVLLATKDHFDQTTHHTWDPVTTWLSSGRMGRLRASHWTYSRPTIQSPVLSMLEIIIY